MRKPRHSPPPDAVLLAGATAQNLQDEPRYRYGQVIRRATMASCGIGLLAEPVAAALSGVSHAMAAGLWLGTGAMWTITALTLRRRVSRRLAEAMIALTIVATILGFYLCSKGIFGTAVDPGLYAFGFATTMTLVGSRFTVISGALFGWGLIVACAIWAPHLYFGSGTELLPVHVFFHMLWWTVPLVFGHVIGRSVQSLIADLAQSRQAMAESQQREIAAAHAAEQVKERAAADRIATLGQIAAAFDLHLQTGMQSLLSLSGMLEHEAGSAEQAAHGARDDGEAVAKLAGVASEESTAVAEATELLSENIGRVREQIAAAEIAGQTAMQTASHSDEALQALVASARRVDSVAEMIRGVANRTNLLAINAAIEAAHVGEAGQGFAVVAVEVKRLASQTTGATAEIGMLVAAIKAALSEMTAAMGLVKDSAATLSGITGVIARAMDEQTAATNQIAGTVSSVARRAAATSDRVSHLIGRIRTTSDANRAMLDGAAAMRASSADLQSRAVEFAAQLHAG